MGRRHSHRRVTDYNAAAAPGRLARAGSWWMGSTKTWAVSVGFMVVTAIGVILMLVLPNDSDPGANAGTGQQIAPASTAPVVEQVSLCKSQKAVKVLPEELVLASYKTTWTRVGDLQEPSSKAAGPAKEVDGWPVCFSRTPEGAMYSAASFAANAVPAMEKGQLREFFTARTSHTGNFAVLMADLPAGSPPKARPTVTISGYLWNNYTPETASVQIRYRAVTGQTTVTIYNLAWERNDWVLIVPGKSDIVGADPTNKSFTPWGGS